MIKANISWNVSQIAKAATQGSMNFSNAIQRGHVWDLGRKSKFIDSLIRGYAVPPMYTVKTNIDAPDCCKKGSKVFDCIDGKQRAEAMRGFLNDEYVLCGLDDFDDVDINGLKFSELSEEVQEAIKSYTMTVYFFSDITDEEISEMMSRLNNGKPLSGVENARIKAKDLVNIIELGNHRLFKENMSEAQLKGYHNEDVVIKTALQILDNQFELSTKNVKEFYENKNFGNSKEKFKKLFDDVYEVIDIIKDSDKKTYKKVMKKTNLVGVIYLCNQVFTEYAKEDDFETMATFLADFFDNSDTEKFGEEKEEYAEALLNGSNHACNVMLRNEALVRAYRNK